jgi:hypothetical protein
VQTRVLLLKRKIAQQRAKGRSQLKGLERAAESLRRGKQKLMMRSQRRRGSPNEIASFELTRKNGYNETITRKVKEPMELRYVLSIVILAVLFLL